MVKKKRIDMSEMPLEKARSIVKEEEINMAKNYVNIGRLNELLESHAKCLSKDGVQFIVDCYYKGVVN